MFLLRVTHSCSEEGFGLLGAGTAAPVAPDTSPDAACGHHTTPGRMTSLLIFPENMEVPWGGWTQLTTGSG